MSSSSKTVQTFKYKLRKGHMFTMLCSNIDIPCSNGDSLQFKRDGMVTLNYCTE